MGTLDVRIRPGRIDDVGFEAELNQSLDWCYDERSLLIEFHDHGYEPSSVLIAELDGEPIGKMELFIGHKSTHGRFAMIRRFAVVDEWRGQGIGKQMLDAAVAHARSAGCTFLELSVDVTNPEAHAFYKREGFIDDRVEVMMRRPLDDRHHASDYRAQRDGANFRS